MSAEALDAVLEVSNLEVYYGGGRRRRRALDRISLRVGRGETLGLIGETGSGKSTLARTVLGLVPAAAGQLRIDGEEVTEYSARQWRALRRRGIVQYVFQDPLRSLDPDATIADSLIEPLLIQGMGSVEASARIEPLLRRVNLDMELLARLPGEVSGGQRQRVAVARALATEPKLVILDEPVSALDSANRVEVLRILEELRAAGVALIFISHDLGSVAGIADRIAVMYQGRFVETGSTRELITAPQHAYTRLLIGSAPTLRSSAVTRAERRALRAGLHVG